MVDSAYDVSNAFKAIEDELISSMIRNMARHRAEELREGYNWEMWQAQQLRELEKYRRQNLKNYNSRFRTLNTRIESLIRQANRKGYMSEEAKILKAIKKGFFANKSAEALTGSFFKINERKLNALINATTNDMKKAETAILRMANDRYRKAIFNAQVYANTGAGTYEKAVDMATKDMLSSGLNCIRYKNGARHTLADYARMAIRTASKRAYLQGEGVKRKEWGISTIIINKRSGACPLCAPFVGKVMVDDVWSGGTKSDNRYPLLSSAMEAGLYHPNCKDSHTTYFPGISTAGDTWTKEELKSIANVYKREQYISYAERRADRYKRLASSSLDAKNITEYSAKADTWENKLIRHAYFKTGNLDSSIPDGFKRFKEAFNALSEEQVVDILRKESDKWIKKLSKEEIRAIRKYTYNSGDKKPNRFFERINAMHRGDLPRDSKLEYYSNELSRAINKNKISYNLMVYRSLDVDYCKDMNIGDVFKEKQFLSTSILESGALNKPVNYVFFIRKGARAAYIEKLSKYPNQKELLLDKNSLVRVIFRKKGVTYLEVIG